VAYRVVQWTTGAVGRESLRGILDHPTPSLQAHLVTLASFVRDVPLSEHVQSASVATAMQAVNAVPAVCAAPSGFVTMADLPFIWNRRIASS
jgi:2,4-diaminopentanoate dehydrogenase